MKTILIVDDEADIAETLRMFVELHGYRVFVALDGREGLSTAIAEHPDLVVTDLMMPKMNGRQLIEALRSTPGLDGVPVILMSALAQEPGLPFLRKPFDPHELVAEIERLLGEE